MSRPSISVIVPAHDHERYVQRAIDSILAQTLVPDEILAVDDGSTDGTAAVLARYGPPVRCFRRQNHGIAATYDFGLQEARGEIVAFLESDDELEPDYLAATVAVLESRPAVSWVSTARRVVDRDGRETGEIVRKSSRGPDYTTESLLLHDLGCASTPVVRRAALRQVGPFDARTYATDSAMSLRFSLDHRMAFLDRPLYRYRLHGENTSRNAVRNLEELVAILRRFAAEHPDFAARHPRLVRRGLARYTSMLGAVMAEQIPPKARAEVAAPLWQAVRWHPGELKYLRRAVAVSLFGAGAYGRWRRRVRAARYGSG